MTITATGLTEEQTRAAAAVDALDLEPIVYKLMHAEPGEEPASLAEADALVVVYRRYLKLAAWYPGESIVPTRAIDRVWHAHLLDTAKYRDDSHAVFGYFLHHFPYFGTRGDDDAAALKAAFERTMELFLVHFGAVPGGAGADCGDGSLCVPEGTECDKRTGSQMAGQMPARPRPDRSVSAA